MSAGSPRYRGDDSDGDADTAPPSEDGTAFLDVLRELKADGCNLLVVGDAPRRLFTEASAGLLGGTDERRYRLLAVTDASPRSVVERLPDPDETPGSLADTTEIINHASPPRSVTDADVSASADPDAGTGADAGADVTPPEPSLEDVSEQQVVDPQLAGLQAELAESMAAFNHDAGGLRPAQLRVGVDSLGPLFDHYDHDVVRRCLKVVTGYVSDYSAMGHYVLTEPYDSELVERTESAFDATIEIRAVDPAKHGHDAEERWHVPDRGLTTDWVPM